jgi:hypothetical protein
MSTAQREEGWWKKVAVSSFLANPFYVVGNTFADLNLTHPSLLLEVGFSCHKKTHLKCVL